MGLFGTERKRYKANNGTFPRNIEQTRLKHFRISTIQLASLSGKLLDQFESMVFPIRGFTALEHHITESESEAEEMHAYLKERWKQIDREMDR